MLGEVISIYILGRVRGSEDVQAQERRWRVCSKAHSLSLWGSRRLRSQCAKRVRNFAAICEPQELCKGLRLLRNFNRSETGHGEIERVYNLRVHGLKDPGFWERCESLTQATRVCGQLHALNACNSQGLQPKERILAFPLGGSSFRELAFGGSNQNYRLQRINTTVNLISCYSRIFSELIGDEARVDKDRNTDVQTSGVLLDADAGRDLHAGRRFVGAWVHYVRSACRLWSLSRKQVRLFSIVATTSPTSARATTTRQMSVSKLYQRNQKTCSPVCSRWLAHHEFKYQILNATLGWLCDDFIKLFKTSFTLKHHLIAKRLERRTAQLETSSFQLTFLRIVGLRRMWAQVFHKLVPLLH